MNVVLLAKKRRFSAVKGFGKSFFMPLVEIKPTKSIKK